MPHPPPTHTSTAAVRNKASTDSTSSALITAQTLPAIIPAGPPGNEDGNRVNAVAMN
jgi:hypothetical protein